MKPLPTLRALLTVVALLGLPAAAAACLWDYDTLKQERARFPSTLELITGKFLRHSPEFYEWRIKDRLEKLKADPSNLQLHDDLAVAYQKTGRTDKAIEVMLAKEAIKPGVYETYSNLGTFYILKGEFAKGLPYIDKALAINPDAHFGREKYQKWLVEYAMTRKGFPMQVVPDEKHPIVRPLNFRDFAEQTFGMKDWPQPQLLQVEPAVKGVLGMMRFADHGNPLLLEALGDLLSSKRGENPSVDAKRLAARCYLLASYKMTDEAAKSRYRTLAERVLELQTVKGIDIEESGANKLPIIEAELKAEIADADTWYADVRAKEVGWIAAGANVEEEFDKLYAKEPTTLTTSPEPFLSHDQRLIGGIVVGVLVTLIAVVTAAWGIGRLARRLF